MNLISSNAGLSSKEMHGAMYHEHERIIQRHNPDSNAEPTEGVQEFEHSFENHSGNLSQNSFSCSYQETTPINWSHHSKQ